MGATPTHQADTQMLDDELWEAEGVLRIPPCMGRIEDGAAEESQHTMEGGAVCKSRVQEKRHKGSSGGTTPASTAASKGPWSRTTSLHDWYPDEHPFIKSQCDTDDPNETPYTMTMSGYPLYKKSYMPAVMQRCEPLGFNTNNGVHYIDYPIRLPHETTVQQAHYTQAIMAPNPLVVVLRTDTNKVFSKPLYAMPVYRFESKPVYPVASLDYLKADAQGREMTDRLIDRMHDISLKAEVHRFRVITTELDRMEQVLVENEDTWGQLAAAKLGAIQRLEMADAIERIDMMNDGFVDDALRVNEEILRGRKG